VSVTKDSGISWSNLTIVNWVWAARDNATDHLPTLATDGLYPACFRLLLRFSSHVLCRGTWMVVWQTNYDVVADDGWTNIDIDLVSSVSYDLGRTWSVPVTVNSDSTRVRFLPQL